MHDQVVRVFVEKVVISFVINRMKNTNTRVPMLSPIRSLMRNSGS